MRLWLCVGLTALACAACRTETLFAQQGSYSSKSVSGMFGPRTLGQPLQSPVRRSDRGIARDSNGDFLGINQGYSGRMFPETKAQKPAAPAAPATQPTQPLAPQTPAAQPGPDEWLRSQGEEGDITPSITPAGPDAFDSSMLGGQKTPARSGASMTTVAFSSAAMADPFALRLAAKLQSISQLQKLSPIRVAMIGETAVLRGRVARAKDRELAENLLRLEPGVWAVRNELIVGSAR